MSLYEGAKTRVIVDSELSNEFEAKVMMHQGSALSACHLWKTKVMVSEGITKDALSTVKLTHVGSVA